VCTSVKFCETFDFSVNFSEFSLIFGDFFDFLPIYLAIKTLLFAAYYTSKYVKLPKLIGDYYFLFS